MPAKFKLDTILTEGKDYQTPERVALVIKAIGTNGATATKLVIDGKPTGEIKELVAPLHLIETNKMGPLSLGDLYYVVPPDTAIKVEGPSGAKMRCIGELLMLAPGEVLPAGLKARFDVQVDHHITFVEGTYSHGTDVKLVADAEAEILSLTPKTIETYLFNYVVMASVANYTPAEGDLAIRFYVDNVPLDAILEKTKVGPADLLAMPRPPRDAVEEMPFSLCDFPVEVLGDHTLSIRVRNTKGADISPAAGTSLDFTVTAICAFKRAR